MTLEQEQWSGDENRDLDPRCAECGSLTVELEHHARGWLCSDCWERPIENDDETYEREKGA